MRLLSSRAFRRAAVGVAALAATAFTVLVQQTPAAAGIWNWNGAYSTLDECKAARMDFIDQDLLTQPCTFMNSGWYFKSAGAY
jgi:hypothetical protein